MPNFWKSNANNITYSFACIKTSQKIQKIQKKKQFKTNIYTQTLFQLLFPGFRPQTDEKKKIKPWQFSTKTQTQIYCEKQHIFLTQKVTYNLQLTLTALWNSKLHVLSNNLHISHIFKLILSGNQNTSHQVSVQNGCSFHQKKHTYLTKYTSKKKNYDRNTLKITNLRALQKRKYNAMWNMGSFFFSLQFERSKHQTKQLQFQTLCVKPHKQKKFIYV